MSAKGLQVVRPFDPWRRGSLCTCPFKYTVNPYTGCGHRCLYCYASSYIRDFFNPRPKKRLLERAARDLSKIPPGSIVNISSSSDPYTPPEEELRLTRRLLRLVAERHVIEVVTKSSLVARDTDILSAARSVVSITITTLDEGLARRLEPGAPPPRARLGAMEKLSEAGVPVVLRLDPLLPWLTDSEENIVGVIEAAAAAGALHVVSSVYKAKPDSLARLARAFPDLAARYRELYLAEGERIHGYWYAPRDYRRKVFEVAAAAAHRLGLTFATCREGAAGRIDPGVSCDGTHLAFRRGSSETRITPSGVSGKARSSHPPGE